MTITINNIILNSIIIIKNNSSSSNIIIINNRDILCNKSPVSMMTTMKMVTLDSLMKTFTRSMANPHHHNIIITNITNSCSSSNITSHNNININLTNLLKSRNGRTATSTSTTTLTTISPCITVVGPNPTTLWNTIPTTPML